MLAKAALMDKPTRCGPDRFSATNSPAKQSAHPAIPKCTGGSADCPAPGASEASTVSPRRPVSRAVDAVSLLRRRVAVQKHHDRPEPETLVSYTTQSPSTRQRPSRPDMTIIQPTPPKCDSRRPSIELPGSDLVRNDMPIGTASGSLGAVIRARRSARQVDVTTKRSRRGAEPTA